ncbi:MAG TPA: hypothetical protein VJL80_08325 [Aeromicrobium sp.]|nr:hypothetical protein [Aeromicrobium sp.]HKY58026.1 hypothetical protein [Aeromicrobium sp.]
MRTKLLIGLALYLAGGVLFGLVTDRRHYMCLPATPSGWTHFGVPDGTLVEAPFGCRPDLESGEKISWIAITTPAWLPLVIRNVVRGDGIAIGNVILGPTDFEEQDREPVGLVPHSGKAGNDR